MQKTVVGIKLLEGGRMPEYGSEGAAGADLFANITEPVAIPPGGRKLIPTGVIMAFPIGYRGRIHSRSGLSLKQGIEVGAGLIDCDYRGEIGVVLFNHSDSTYVVHPQAKVAQICIEQYEQAEFTELIEVGATSRGAGGFGSTGV